MEENEYQQIVENSTATFNNSVIVVNEVRRWLMVSVVTNEIDQTTIDKELRKLDDLLKTVYHVNQSDMQNEVLAIVGILVTPNIDSRSTLKTYHPVQMDKNSEDMFITKMEWDSDQKLDTWMIDLFGKKIRSNIKNNSSGKNIFLVILNF